MASTVQTRPNHYETLGLTPAASQAEIERAFARELGLSQMRAFGGTAQVSIAYGVLRDPAKRRAYDEALGLNPPPPLVQPRNRYSLSIPAIHVDPPKRPEPNSEARMASFIASSLREPVSAEPQHDIAPPPPREPAKPSFVAGEEPRPVSARPLPRFLEEEQKIADDQPVDWRRTAGMAGAVVAAVGLIGAWAGWEAGNEVEAEELAPTNQAVTVALPKAKPATFASLTETARESRGQRRARQAVASRGVDRAPLSIEIADAQQPAPTAAPRNPPEVNPAEEAYAEAAPAAPVEATAASLPLSHATIARTIGRIGYPCGSVASTSQVLGKVFKVTCTSGDTYRAAPIHGRYRFKRL